MSGHGLRRLGPIALVALAPPLYRSAVRTILRRNVARIQAGELAVATRVFTPDVHFVFPGESSWKADIRSREGVVAWERRFLEAGLRLKTKEILVDGPPWETRIALRFTDQLVTPDGDRAYENAGVICGTARWGRVFEFVLYEDTQKLGPLDEYLARLQEGESA
jgi:ketosteroid isomerase-like protein